MDSYHLLLREMLRLHMDRGDCVAAVGGGMVGDLAGFAAATYMRGVDFYNIPTTLLAQVDSSVGGKTAIDLDGVKNAVGAFHQPRAVLIDTDVLRTLSPRQTAEGLAGSVKMAMTCDASLLEPDRDGLRPDRRPAGDHCPLPAHQGAGGGAGSHRAGAAPVLNFGHTLGHAIESCAGESCSTASAWRWACCPCARRRCVPG